jgi:polyhydroxyalkanoate synthesis regulator phasin
VSEAGEERREGPGTGPEAVGEALRAAVERTLAATAESASGTRERAQELLDDVVRRGQSAGQEVARRSESATTRLADAIGELRAADSEGMRELAERLEAVERRLDALEHRSKRGRPHSGSGTSPLEPDEDGDLRGR